MVTLTHSHFDLDTKRDIGSAWGRFVALGVALIALGVLAFLNLPAATSASVYIVGILMLVAAGAQLGAAFLVRGWSGFGLLFVSALLYGLAGVLTIANPTLAAQVLTLMLGFALIFSGVMRIWWSVLLRSLSGWGWIIASGIISVIAGSVFIAGWPADSVWLLGMVLAFDLVSQGATAIGWGFALKEITK